MTAQIISFQEFKDKREAEKIVSSEVAEFYMCLSGTLPYDDLDDLIEDLEEQGISVDSVMVMEEDDSPDDLPIPTNDTDYHPGDYDCTLIPTPLLLSMMYHRFLQKIQTITASFLPVLALSYVFPVSLNNMMP